MTPFSSGDVNYHLGTLHRVNDYLPRDKRDPLALFKSWIIVGSFPARKDLSRGTNVEQR